MRLSTAYLIYPFSGTLINCQDNGVGKVRLHTERAEPLLVHINDHGGKRLGSLKPLEGKPILCALGGNPFRCFKKHADWKQWVVKWVLLDQVEGNLSLANVDERQEDYLNNLADDDFYALLSAKWYVELWKKDARSPPLTPLARTEVVDNVFIKRLKSSKNLTELIRLLHAMEQSPWFDVPSSKNASNASSAYIQVLLKDINSWPPAPFHIPPDRQISKNLNDTYLRWEKLLLPRIRKANAVAIDLETNGDAIFQIGWFPFVKTGLAQRAKGLSQKQIQEAISTCLPPGSTPCIVGQNLLAWDLPILLSKGVELPANTPTWDTLIASWLLAPWEPSHALVVQENAHRADADAKETYKRYVEQVEKLTPCLHTPIANIYALIDNLFEHPELLGRVRSLTNPHALNALGPKPVLIPTSRKREATWSPRLKLTYLTVERDLEDPVLKPECCFDIGRSSNDILARTIAVVVADAHRQGVFIRLSMLPIWLVDDALRDRLRTAHHDFRPEANDAVYTPVYFVSDLHNHDAAWIERLAGDTGFEIPYPEETALEWLSVHAKPLTYQQIQARFPPAVLENRSRRELLLVHDANGAQMLLFEPPGLGDETPCWWGFETPPDWLAGSESSATRPDNHEKWFRLPCWKEGEIDDLDLSRIFATPDTLNRRLHISEILLQLLNLLRAKENSDQILLCGMRWPGEAQKAQQILAALSKTVIHAESPLRQLQHLCKLNRDILICAQRDLPQNLDAADKLGLSVRVVLDEAPLHQWLALTELRNKGLAREASPPELQTVSLSNHAIKTGLYTMLVPWLKGLLKREDPMPTPVLVLDARLFDLPGGKDIQFPWEKIPFYQNEELLPNPEDLKAFQALTVRPPEEINTTCSYEDMERLFQNHWGHDKFNPLQAPAVRALAETEEDLLLRLPTGAGKSAVFQVPALLVGSKSKRLSIVISPLRALMTDQVTGLHAKHFSETVDYLSGGREPWVNHDVYRGIVDGRLQLVYVAPERFRVPRFVEALERRRANDGGLEFIVFDEAHCVSEWGFDFRPDYLYAADYVSNWRRGMTLPGKGHRLLLTSATVTERNREDLESKLLGTDSGYANLPSPEDMPHPIQDFIQLESMVADDADDAAASGKYRKVVDILEKLDLKKSAAIIFVRRRVDCHALAEALNAEAGRPESVIPHAKALPFHAGLSESIKNEAIELLNKERSVNVLVCTKAFGMGMDISHLHACIHYSPTNFIEDYLQEVGRIGRGKEERLASGHAQVKATLLFNQQDFDDNLKRLEESAIKPPDLEDFFNYCRSIPSGISHNDQWVCLVPTSINTPGHKVFNENQVSACLFWLEQAKVLRVEGRYPPHLNLQANPAALHKLAASTSLNSSIAAALVDMLKSGSVTLESSPKSTHTKDDNTGHSLNLFSRLLMGLKRGLVALVSPATSSLSTTSDVGPQTPAAAISTSNARSGWLNVSVPLERLRGMTGIKDVNELLDGLFELQKTGAVELHKEFIATPFSAPSQAGFWALLDEATRRLSAPTDGRFTSTTRRQFSEDLRDWYRQHLLNNPHDNIVQTTSEHSREAQIKRESYRAVNTSMRLARYAGLEIQESIRDGDIVLSRIVPAQGISDVQRDIKKHIEGMDTLFSMIQSRFSADASSESIPVKIQLADMMTAFDKPPKIRFLKELLKLLDSAGLCSWEGQDGEWTSLVVFNRSRPLPIPDAAPIESPASSAPGVSTAATPQEDMLILDCYADMVRRHEMQRLRGRCMLVLALLSPESRVGFIDRYFKAVGEMDLQKILDDSLGDLDDAVLEAYPEMKHIQEVVRQTRFSEEMKKLKPQQESVCISRHDRKMLVNAGPGSGKTYVLMMRCAHLIHQQHIRPSEILVLAFNRAVVTEIRDRVRDLFRKLGFGNYANSLDVTTFHSFAMQNSPPEDDRYDDDAIGQALHKFASKMRNDDFARPIAQRYKAVLVDEFQDMNEDFYVVVDQLIKHCKGGGMVIGDDDQDILTWNRRKWNKDFGREFGEAPLEAVDYFERFKARFQPDEYVLDLNFRSAKKIVEVSDAFICKQTNMLKFTRMKTVGLKAHRDDSGRHTLREGGANCSTLAIKEMANGSVAILCRTNQECREMYNNLIRRGAPANHIELLGQEDFRLYQLRPTGKLLDMCKTKPGFEFIEGHIWEEMGHAYTESGHADRNKGIELLNHVYHIVCMERGRPRCQDMIDFIQETRQSELERLKRKMNIGNNSSRLVISTVHKVKGLEYDAVFVPSSTAKFPMNGFDAPDFPDGKPPAACPLDSAEEARLHYVAMTRAKNVLYRYWGDREEQWAASKAYPGVDHDAINRLEGIPTEYVVSWPGWTDQVNTGLQHYIETEVSPGDTLTLNGSRIYHGKRHIGLLSKKTKAKNPAGPYSVSNVLRYTCGPYMEKHKPQYYKLLHPDIKKQKWCYTVLIKSDA